MIWFGQIMLNQLMQSRKIIIGNHRKHMMLDVIIHIPIYKSTEGVHIYCPSVQPMVKYIICQTSMLKQTRHNEMPRT